MRPHYITLHTVRRAVRKSGAVDVFMRHAAMSSTQPNIHRSKWIPVEAHKRPGAPANIFSQTPFFILEVAS